MHEVKEMIQKIADEGNRDEMEELSDILDEAICVIKNYDEALYEDYKMQLYRMAYGNTFTQEMAEKIVSKMRPYKERWTLDETREFQYQYGLNNIDELDFYVVMNSAYNDFRDLFGDNIEMYVRYTENFINDEDARDGKVFLYFTTIVK